MKPQTMYRGESNKKTKPTKTEKLDTYFAKVKRKEEDRKKKEAAA